MDLPARTDDSLSQPTRAQLFAWLGEIRRPASTDELAEHVKLHPNGVRVHLEVLRQAGLVVRERPRQRRGRPRDIWMIAPDAQPGGDPPHGYADLGRWLTRVVSSGKTSRRAIEATGREIGRDLVPDGGTLSAEPTMHAALASMGFQPRRETNAQGGLTYRLCNCPYRHAAGEDQQVVCTLHRGITRGLLDQIQPDTVLTAFVARDPYAAGCLIELRGGMADEYTARAAADHSPGDE